MSIELTEKQITALLKNKGKAYRFKIGYGVIHSLADYRREECSKISVTHITRGKLGNIVFYHYWLKSYGLTSWDITSTVLISLDVKKYFD